MPRRIRILLADDHTMLRQVLAVMLQSESDMEVVGEAVDGVEAVELAHKHHPDVILMDVTMPRLNGVEATRRITTELPDTRVIGLSMHDGNYWSNAMQAAGAKAFLSKGEDPQALLETIRRH